MLSPPIFRKSGDETVNVAYIKKTVAKSKLIFKLKSPRSLSQGWFLHKDNNVIVHTAASIHDFKWWQRCEDDPSPALFGRFHPSRLGSQSESEDAAGWPLLVPGEHQDELGWGV